MSNKLRPSGFISSFIRAIFYPFFWAKFGQFSKSLKGRICLPTFPKLINFSIGLIIKFLEPVVLSFFSEIGWIFRTYIGSFIFINDSMHCPYCARNFWVVCTRKLSQWKSTLNHYTIVSPIKYVFWKLVTPTIHLRSAYINGILI